MPPLPTGKKRLVLWVGTAMAGPAGWTLARFFRHSVDESLIAAVIVAVVLHYWLRLQLHPAMPPAWLYRTGSVLAVICLGLPFGVLLAFFPLTALGTGPKAGEHLLINLLKVLAVSPVCGLVAPGCMRGWRPLGVLVFSLLGSVWAAVAAWFLILLSINQ